MRRPGPIRSIGSGLLSIRRLDFGKDAKLGVDLGLHYGLRPATPDLALKLNFNVPIYTPHSAAASPIGT